MRRMNCAPNRAASGARGRVTTSRIDSRPACASPPTLSSSTRKAASGRSFERGGALSLRHDRDIAEARHRPGAADAVGNAKPRIQPLPPQPPRHVLQQRFLAAEQMRAAGDIKQQAVRRIEADERRVAVAPFGDRFQQRAIGRQASALRTSMPGCIARTSASGNPAMQAKPRGRVVERADAQRGFDGFDDDQRRVTRQIAAALDPVGREPPQPHREIAPRRHAHDGSRRLASGRSGRGGFCEG